MDAVTLFAPTGDAARFIHALTGDAETPCTWQTFDDNEDRRDPSLARILHGPLSKVTPELARMSALGCGIFVCVNETDLRGRSTQNVIALRALFVDSDTGPLPALPLRPSIVVQSANGQHAYWLMKSGEELARFTEVQDHLADALGTDHKVKDLPRVMRVPGFLHQKGEAFRVTLGDVQPLLLYTIDDVVATLPPRKAKHAPQWEAPAFKPDRGSALEQFQRYLERVPGAVEGQGGDAHTYRVACLAVCDFDLSDADAALAMGEWNGKCSPPWSSKELDEKIRHARKYARGARGSKLREERPPQAPPSPQVESVDEPEGISLHAIAARMKAAAQSEIGKSDVSLAKALLEHLTIRGRRPVSTRGTLYLYNDESGSWEELKHDDAMALIQCYDGAPVGKNGKLEIGPMKARAIHQSAIYDLDHRDSSFFDVAPEGVAFRNGFVTVGADGPVIRGKSPDNRATHCLPFDYSPEAECPEWTAVLRRVFKGSPSPEDDAKLLQEFAGACLTGQAWRFARCLILSGGGNNGKSVVVEVVTEQLFPVASVTHTSPQSWAKPEFLSRLRNSKLNVANEMPASDIQGADAFKAVIDGGALDTRDLYANPYTLRPRAGHIFLCNELPGNRDNSEGFWRRVLVLPFKRNFSKDPDETGKIRTKEEVKATLGAELPGIALWALHGATRLLRHGYTIPESHRASIGEWRCDVDQVAAFLDECCVLDGGVTQHGEIYKSFTEWCELTNRQVIGNRKLAARLRMLGIEDGRDRDGVHFKLTVMMKGSWGIGKGMRANG
jgi:P4 family phage/plasmid primase-like protien